MAKSAKASRPPTGKMRCAIYTRKSSEEGLEQAFNSLDAQREACAAFVLSQKHEGWVVLPALYDDGGFSGGTMDRPALQRLLDDIRAGQVDVVVVYKIDRLTRSLFDFAKIVEAFDARGVSFVSITQQFNTTTSMGRLTLNVLLSFAQFEREVAGERIRDKIAASKKKGMWMGGLPSLGYDVQNRKLVVNEEEAGTVVHIFRRYVELRSVRVLQAELDAAGIRSKRRILADGTPFGGQKLSRGALYLMLQNRIYRGEITHKGNAYPAEHQPIVDKVLWDQVQAILAENRVDRATGADAKQPSLLAGLIFDESGERLTPSHAVKKGTRYRYYVSRSLIVGTAKDKSTGRRIPAANLETLVITKLRSWRVHDPERHYAGKEIRSSDPDWWRTTHAPCKASPAIIAATITSGQPVPVPSTPRAASNTARLPNTSLRVQIQAERMFASPPRKAHKRPNEAALATNAATPTAPIVKA